MGISLRWKWRRTSDRPCSLRRRLTAGPVVATAVIEAPSFFFFPLRGRRPTASSLHASYHRQNPLTPALSPFRGRGEMGDGAIRLSSPSPAIDVRGPGLSVLGAADYAPPAK